MKIFQFRLKTPIILFVLTALLSGCGNTATNNSNPAHDRMAAEAGIATESENTGGGIVPNVKPIVDASILAAANTEAVNIKTAIRLYLNDHPSSTSLISDKLWPGYITSMPKATYVVNPTSLKIIKVNLLSGGWNNIVFSLSQQKWLEGNPDNDHSNDQDIP